MTDQEKKAAFEGVLPLLVKNPATREQILNQYADAPESSPMAAKILEGASAAAPFIAMRAGGKRMAGVGLAATAANLAGMIAAAITKRRTAEEQAKADTGVLRNLAKLIPGVGTYDAMKRIGRQAQENVDRINERRAKRQAEKKADAQGMAKQASNLAVEKQEKKAEFSWDKVTGEIEKLRTAFNKQDATTKALLATGGGALGGMVLSSLFGGKAGRGAMLGAMAGGASQVDWRKVLRDIEAARAANAATLESTATAM